MASMSAKLEKETLGHLEAKQQLQHLQMMVRMEIRLILSIIGSVTSLSFLQSKDNKT